MATYRDGNVMKATPNTIKAMKRSAESRQCPVCGRKSAVKRDPETGDRYCRWTQEFRYVTTPSQANPRVVGTRSVALCSYHESHDDLIERLTQGLARE